MKCLIEKLGVNSEACRVHIGEFEINGHVLNYKHFMVLKLMLEGGTTMKIASLLYNSSQEFDELIKFGLIRMKTNLPEEETFVIKLSETYDSISRITNELNNLKTIKNAENWVEINGYEVDYVQSRIYTLSKYL